MGMLAAAAVTLGLTTYFPQNTISWNMILIAGFSGFLLIKKKLSIPKTILIAAALGIIFG